MVSLPLVTSSLCLLALNQVWYLTDKIALQAEARTVDIKLLDKSFGALINRGYKKFGYCFKGNRNEPIMADKVPNADAGKESKNKEVSEIIRRCQTLELAVDQEARAMLNQVFHSNAERLMSYLHIISATLTIDHDIEQLILKDQAASEAIWHDWDRTRATINIITAVALIVATALALLISSYFSYDLLQRIQELARRTRKLSSFRPLSKKSQHVDEIGLIDHTLQSVAEKLASEETERNIITNIISQNILKPAAQCHDFATIFNTSASAYLVDISKWTNVVDQAYTKMHQFASALRTTGSMAARGKKLDRTYFVLSDRVQAQLALLSTIASQKSISLQNHCHPISILADGEAFDRILNNLIGNAIKFAPEQSNINISARTNAAGAIEISVFDQGPGIKKEQGDLFERFAQQDSAQKSQGFGVGLAICRDLVKAHGGDIGHRPVQPRGTEFWFTLPQGNALMDTPVSITPELPASGAHVYQSSLFKQSLLVMLIPLTMQGLGLVWIQQRIQSDFDLLNQVRRQEELALKTSRMWLNIFDGCYSTALYLGMQKGTYETRARQKLKTIRTLLPQLTPQAIDMPDQVAALKALMAASELEAGIAERSLDTMGIFEAQDILSSLAFSLDRASVLTAKISHILDLQFSQIADLVQVRQKAQQADQTILNLILLTNSIVALALTLLFARTMNARINSLVQATEDILNGKAVQRPQQIKDELDQLKDTLATESAKLSQAKAARENLLASIAHDLRSPLQAIKLALHSMEQALLKAINTNANSALATLANKTSLDETYKTLQTLATQIDITEDLINDLLTLNKLQQSQTADKERVNISEISLAVVEELAELAGEKSIFVDLEIKSNPCLITGDQLQLSQLIKRLIKLSINNSSFDSSVMVTVGGQGSSLITIKDTGKALGAVHKAPYTPSANLDTVSLQQVMSLALCSELCQVNALKLILPDTDTNTFMVCKGG